MKKVLELLWSGALTRHTVSELRAAVEKCVKDAHGAGYHNALTGVDPFDSEREAVKAALAPFDE